MRIHVANDEPRHVALPKLYGAPAYARPPAVPVKPLERPFDPDELPLEAVQTDEERELARQLRRTGTGRRRVPSPRHPRTDTRRCCRAGRSGSAPSPGRARGDGENTGT